MPGNEYDDLLGQVEPLAANEYDQAALNLDDERKDGLRRSFVSAAAAGVPPEQQARVLELAKRHNLPPDIVARNLPSLERQERQAPPDLEIVADRAPGLSRWLADPQKAALANDDLEPLVRLERSARIVLPIEEPPSFAGAIGRAAATGLTDLQASAWHLAAIYGMTDPATAAENIAEANKRAAALREKAPDYAKEFNEHMAAEGNDINRAWRRFTGSFEKAQEGRILDALVDYYTGAGATVGQTLDMIGAAVIRPRGLMHSTAENFAASLPAMALGGAGAATLGPVGLAAGAFVGSVPVEIGAWMQQAMVRKGVDMNDPQAIAAAFGDPTFMAEARGEAERKGITTAAVDMVFNAFAGRAIAKAAGKGLLAKGVAGAQDVAIQAAGEATSEAAGQGAAKKTVSGIDVGDAILEGIVSLGQNVGEVAAGASVRGAFHVKTAIAAQQVSRRTGDAMAAQRAAQALQEAGEAVEASKTAKRLPEAIREVVAAAAEGGEAGTVYFQTEAWDNYWTGQGLSPAKAAADIMGDGGKAYTEAKATGVQMPIELADYISKVAPTEHYKALLPEARVKPDGMSLSEATEFLKGLPGLMDEIAKEAVEGRTVEATKKEASVNQVREQVTAMLVAAKVPRPEAERLGQLWGSHMQARAERLGKDPMELFGTLGLEVRRGVAPAATAATPQAPSPEIPDAIEPAAGGDTSFDFGENLLAPSEEDVAFLKDEAALEEIEFLRQAGGVTPVMDAIRAAGGLSMKKLKKAGAMGELPDLHWTGIFKTGGSDLSHMAETLSEQGKLEKYDEDTLLQKIREEAAAIKDFKRRHGQKAYALLRRTLYQGAEEAPTFYSKLQRTIEQKLGNTATVEQVRAITREVKGEELKWSGLEDFIKGKEKVKKDELLEFLRGNQVEIKEEVLGAKSIPTKPGLQDREIDISRLTEEQREAYDFLHKAGFDIAIPPEEDMPRANEVHFLDFQSGDIYDRVMLADELNLRSRGDFTDENGELIVRRLRADEARQFDEDPGYSGVTEGSWALIGNEGFDVIPIAESDVDEETARDMAHDRVPQIGTIVYKGKSIPTQDILDAADKFGPGKDETRYGSYVLPGGQNYREVLFTLPISTQKKKGWQDFRDELHEAGLKDEADEVRRHLLDAPADSVNQAYVARAKEKMGDAWMAAYKDTLSKKGAKTTEAFRSSHFEQKNILAHTRLTDRVDANGKRLLFIEEIQSDWHQKGRRHGYQGEGDKKTTQEILGTRRRVEDHEWANGPAYVYRDDFYITIHDDGKFSVINGNMEMEFETIEQAEEHLANEVIPDLTGDKPGGVPDAPFKKSWHEFVLKRLIRMAADGGYDAIAWTTGEQQAERYDLSKQVSAVHYIKTDNGEYKVWAQEKGSSRRVEIGEHPAARLPDVVGKELADKIIAGEGEQMRPQVMRGEHPSGTRSFFGQNLKVGGEGMRGFYDGIVPAFLNKFGKKYKAEAGETTLGVPKVLDPGADIYETENFVEVPPTHGEAQAVKVHSLAITPELRNAAIQQGFELFQDTPEGARGSLKFGTASGNPKFTIELLAKANRSTFLHESGHVWLEGLRADAATIAAIPEDQQTPAQRQLLKDWDTTTAWLGIEGGYKRDRRISTAQHEQFARGFEAYLLEGKAPSAALRAAFRRFKAWLVKIYTDMTSLKVELSPDIRGVFDRLLATQYEIAEAEAEVQRLPLFTDPAAAGLDTKAVEGYMAAVDEAKQAAEEELAGKVLEKVRREETTWWKDERKKLRAEVASQVAGRKEQIALAALQKGKTPEGADYAEGHLPPKIDRAAIAPERLKRMPRGVTTSKGGAHPEVLAGIFGYGSAEQFLAAIERAQPYKETVEAETDRIMIERHGDILRDIETLQDEAMKAIHNDKQADVLRAELRHLASDNFAAFKGLAKKIVGRVHAPEAARAEAEKAIGRRKVRELKPPLFKAAEAKAAREALDAYLKGDIQAAFDAKRRQLAAYELYRAAVEAKEAQEKALNRFKKLRQADDKLAKRRDMDVVNAARAILSKFGLDRTEKPASEYLEQIRNFDPDLYETVNELVTAATENAGSWKEITVDDFQAMTEAVDSLWSLSLRTQQMWIQGRLIDKQEAVDALRGRLQELGLPEERAGYKRAMTNWEKTKMYLLGWRAALRRVESWVDAADNHKPDGLFRKYLWAPVSEATGDYRVKKREVLKQYLALLEDLKGDLGRGQIIEAPELGYTFGKGTVSGKVELLHALLHTGNESNMAKLLRGRGWGDYDATGELDTTRWNAFIKRAASPTATPNGPILTKTDYDVVQKIWDLLDSLKPGAQKAHKEIYGYYFGEVTAQALTTPYGVYRGGYVPAITDPFIVREADIRAEKEAIEKSNNSFMFPTAGRGFTKKRVEKYAKPLLLDLGLLAGHIDKVLRFTYIEPRIKDAGRLVFDRAFRDTLNDFDPAVGGDMLVPWLQRTAQQKIEAPGVGLGGRGLDNFMRGLRRRTGLQIMTANVVNAMQQFTGISIAAIKVKPHHLRNALWAYSRDPKRTAADVAAKSKFMDTRTTSQIFEVQQQLDELLLDPTKFEEARAFAQKHGYILQAGAQNIVDTVVWTGAYEEATEAKATEPEAVAIADAAVRATQGSFNPEDVSRFETGSAFVRMFTMFYSYFNMQANLLGSEFAVLTREGGLKKNHGRALYVYTLGFMIPAVLSELIVRAMSGNFDEDDDDNILDDFMAAFFFGQVRSATAMFPVAGQVIQAGINTANNKWYDDRITVSPAISMIDSAVGAPKSVYKAIAEDGSKKKAIRDTLTLLGLLTGLPLTPAARPLGYLADLSEGKARASGPFDFARGLATGRSKRE